MSHKLGTSGFTNVWGPARDIPVGDGDPVGGDGVGVKLRHLNGHRYAGTGQGEDVGKRDLGLLGAEEERSPEAVESQLGVVELDGLIGLSGTARGDGGVEGLDGQVRNVTET